MESTNKNKHLVLDDRYDIQHGLDASLSFKAIGVAIGKDCTTVSKEVRAHIIFVKKVLPIALSTTVLTDFTATTLAMPATNAQEKTRRNVVPVVPVSRHVLTTKKKYAHYSRNLPTSATDAPRETNALSKSIFMMLVQHRRSMRS